MNTEQKSTNIGAIGLVQEIQKPSIMTIEGPDGRKAPVLLTPNGQGGMTVHEGKRFIDDYQPRAAPERRRGMAVLESLASFVDHVNRFRVPESAIFMRRTPAMIEAVYDYHTSEQPRYGEHRATFAFPASTAWKAWREVNGKELGQTSFAEFLENHSADLIDPTRLPPSALEAIRDAETATGVSCVHPEAIRVLAKGLEYHRKASSVELRNLRTGECKISFEEKLTGKDGEVLDIPGLFAIAVELFDARMPGELDPTDPTKRLPPTASRYVIPVRLRVRAASSEGDGLRWTLLLHNVERCIDLALSEAAERVSTETKCPVFWGSPEK